MERNKIFSVNKILLILAIFGIISIFCFDLPIAEFINTEISDNTRIIWNIITNTANCVLLVVFAVIARILYIIIKDKNKKELYKPVLVNTFYGLLASIVLNYTIISLKYIFSRIRPYYFLRHIEYKTTFLFFNNKNLEAFKSFPSGHSTTAWAFATFILITFNLNIKLKTLLILFSFVLSISRIILNVHYLSDIIFGAIIGIFLMKNIVQYLNKKEIL